MRTWTTVFAAATLVAGATTAVRGAEPAEAEVVPAADGEIAAGTNPRCRSWGFREVSAADAELRGVCPLQPWDDASEDWPFKQRLKQAHYAPGVGAGATPQTQIMGIGYGKSNFPKGGPAKAVGNLIQSGQLESDDVIVLGKSKKKGPYRVYRILTAGAPGDGGPASYHLFGDLDDDMTNNVATSVTQPIHAFQGTQGGPSLLFADGRWAGGSTDFTKTDGGFYNLNDEADMVAWSDSGGVWVVIPARSAPDGFRPLTFAAGAEDQPGSLGGAMADPKRIFLDGSGSADGEHRTYHVAFEQEVSGARMNGQPIHAVQSSNLGLNTYWWPTSADEDQVLQTLGGSTDAEEPPLLAHVTYFENDNKLEVDLPVYAIHRLEGTGLAGDDTGISIVFAKPFFSPGLETLTEVGFLNVPTGLEGLFEDGAKDIGGRSVPTSWTDPIAMGRAQGGYATYEEKLLELLQGMKQFGDDPRKPDTLGVALLALASENLPEPK